MKLIDLGISPLDSELIIRGFSEGKYHLMCGAGVSLGATGGDGMELDIASRLAIEITNKLKLQLDLGEEKNLLIAYEEAKAKNRSLLNRFLRARFVGCKPTWQSEIFNFNWQRIWSLNIDDVLEQAFQLSDSLRMRGTVVSCDWKEPLLPKTLRPGEIQVIHLHGRASDLETSKEGLIFSTDEYAAATKQFEQWHAAFQTMYIQDPVLVCGARLSDELDFAIATRLANHARQSWGYPSLIVLKEIGVNQADRLRRFGLIPVQSEAEPFFQILKAELGKYSAEQKTIGALLGLQMHQRFLTQFRELDWGEVNTGVVVSDFYGGDEPTWNDIRSDRDTLFLTTEKMSLLLRSPPDKSYVALLHGHFATGKTTALLRIARIAITLGFRPYIFRNETGLDVEATIQFASLYPSTLLIVDGAGDHGEAIGRLLSLAKERGVLVRVFLAERTYRLRGLRLDIPDEYRREFALTRLAPLDLDRVVAKRRSLSRLGQFVHQRNSEVVNYLEVQCKGELIECMSRLEFGEGFRARVRRVMSETLSDESIRPLIVAVACVHRFGYALPLRTALVVAKTHFGRFRDLFSPERNIEGPLIRERHGLRLRHRILSEYAWRDLFSQEEKYVAIKAVVASLAPLINPAIISAKEYPHLIVRKVLDQENVAESVNLKALPLFEELEDLLGWNSRYWEQRGLLELQVGNFGKAYSYGQKAVSLEKHPFTFNSLGAICMKQAIRLYEANPAEAKALYFEGEEALSRSFNIAQQLGRSFEHPFVTFFSATLSILRGFHWQDADRNSIEELWNVWIKRTDEADCYAGIHGKARVKELRDRWLKYQLSKTVERKRPIADGYPHNSKASIALSSEETREFLIKAVRACTNSSGWAPVAAVAAYLQNRKFDWGPSKLGKYLVNTKLFELESRPSKGGVSPHVRPFVSS